MSLTDDGARCLRLVGYDSDAPRLLHSVICSRIVNKHSADWYVHKHSGFDGDSNLGSKTVLRLSACLLAVLTCAQIGMRSKQ